jgi:hypothetical protein
MAITNIEEEFIYSTFSYPISILWWLRVVLPFGHEQSPDESPCIKKRETSLCWPTGHLRLSVQRIISLDWAFGYDWETRMHKDLLQSNLMRNIWLEDQGRYKINDSHPLNYVKYGDYFMYRLFGHQETLQFTLRDKCFL